MNKEQLASFLTKRTNGSDIAGNLSCKADSFDPFISNLGATDSV
jgi:hypothetical protein